MPHERARTDAGVDMNPDAALARLEAGNRRFVEGSPARRDDPAVRASLTEGQDPFALVLGCADSRVPPELVYDQGLGDLFTIRVAGNTAADPLVLGTVEFAVTNLDLALVVVLGHERCAAVTTAVECATRGATLTGHLPAVVEPVVPVVRAVGGDDVDTVIAANVRASVERLSENAVVAAAVSRGSLRVVGHRYELASGRVVPVP